MPGWSCRRCLGAVTAHEEHGADPNAAAAIIVYGIELQDLIFIEAAIKMASIRNLKKK